jgi:hypothetical protein
MLGMWCRVLWYICINVMTFQRKFLPSHLHPEDHEPQHSNFLETKKHFGIISEQFTNYISLMFKNYIDTLISQWHCEILQYSFYFLDIAVSSLIQNVRAIYKSTGRNISDDLNLQPQRWSIWTKSIHNSPFYDEAFESKPVHNLLSDYFNIAVSTEYVKT